MVSTEYFWLTSGINDRSTEDLVKAVFFEGFELDCEFHRTCH